MDKQRSSAWLKKREGRFTASEIWKLFVSGRKKDDMFGEVAKTYIREKALQELTGYRQHVDSYAMRRGREYEPIAIGLYSQVMGVTVNPCFFYTLGDHMGASPDGILPDGGVLEVKCPNNGDIHMRYLYADNLFDADKKYYYQVQCQMLCKGTTKAHFASYHPDTTPFNLGVKVVPYDVATCEEMISRVKAAVQLKNEYVDRYVSMGAYEETRDVAELLLLTDF